MIKINNSLQYKPIDYNIHKSTEDSQMSAKNKITKSFTLSAEAIKAIEKEAERVDRSASWVVNDLALQIKQK